MKTDRFYPLTSVVSRKEHGAPEKTFDIDLTPPAPGIECRSGGVNSDYTMVFTFSTPITSCGVASTGIVTNGPEANQCQVQLTNVPNADYTTVELTGVLDENAHTVDAAGTIGLLVGDVNFDGFVLSGDYTATRQKSGTPVDENTFKYDVNTDGFILSGDYTAVRQRSGDHF